MTSRKTSNFSRNVRRSALSLALGMCFVGAAMADTGGLRIVITGADGQPVPNATVKVSSPASLSPRTATTGADGSVRLQGLDPATNYTVQVIADGFQEFSATNVAVVSGQNLSVGYALGGGSGGTTTLDAIVVTGASLAAIDTTSAVVGTTLTLDMVESLPTGRSFQSYLQLVPGVKPSAGGNPSSKSGVNYSDIGGAVGTSSDNIYIIDGVDVTDHQTGTFGANFNSEIIQEQQVITGGVPAEFAGGSGLISKVVTKSGGDTWHGSVNYYFQNDSLVQDDKHAQSNGFSTYDTALTLGGPIVKEKLWIFGSYQKKFREDQVLDANTGNLLRNVETDSTYAFLKATWQITENDRLTASYFDDPFDRSGSTSSSTLNNRDVARVQGGERYKLDYTRNWGNLLFNAYGFQHTAEVSDIPALTNISLNNVAFRNLPSTLADRSQGGGGTAIQTQRDREEYGFTLEYYLDTNHGTHTFKGGYSFTDNEYWENSVITGDGSRYSSIAAANSGVTFADFVGAGWAGTRSIVAADIPRILGNTGGFGIANASAADQAYFMNLLDTNHDGEISPAEIQAMQFNSTAGNPTGQVNNYRIMEYAAAPYSVSSEGKVFFLQDTWTMNQWTVNAGVRAEEWTHFDSKGDQSYRFKWEFAPRFSVVYDLFGDGRSKIFGFAGRYYDPIRTNMSDFAGNLTGPELHEQIFIGDRWLTFRSRGGPKTPDALFAPSTKTPYTDEFMLGFSNTIGNDMSLSVTMTKRTTQDILEDYDLTLYSDPTTVIGDPDFEGHAGPGSLLFLPWSYFGYSSQPNSNYVIATLAGGRRDYLGYEITLQKFKSNNWQGMVTYTYNSAHGNTNSDSNADFQGDWLAIDPRAPNMWGPQPGNIKHQLKGFASYEFDFGLELAGVFNWNSGALYTTSQLISARYLPIMGDVTEWGGMYDSWVEPGQIGANEGPAYYTFDARAKYVKELGVGQIEFFLDVFNILNKQSATSHMALLAGSGAFSFGQPNAWVAPRRAYLGVRYSF